MPMHHRTGNGWFVIFCTVHLRFPRGACWFFMVELFAYVKRVWSGRGAVVLRSGAWGGG